MSQAINELKERFLSEIDESKIAIRHYEENIERFKEAIEDTKSLIEKKRNDILLREKLILDLENMKN